MVIDSHAHLYHPRWYPYRFQEYLVRDYLQRRGKKLSSDRLAKETARLSWVLSDDDGSSTIRLMDQAGIDQKVILIIDWELELGKVETPIGEIHREILGICARFPNRLIGFAGIDPRRPGKDDLLAWAFDELGARGLKLHPTSSEWSLRDESTHQAIAIAAERGFPIMIHTGKTLDCLTSVHAQPTAVVELARAFPEATLIAGHSGFNQWREFVCVDDLPKNLYFDISGWQERLGTDPGGLRSDLTEFLKILPGRVFFGTDGPFFSYNVPFLEQRWVAFVEDCLDSLELQGIQVSDAMACPLLVGSSGSDGKRGC